MCYKYATPKLKDLLEHLENMPPFTVNDYYACYLSDGFAHHMMPVTTAEEPNVIQPAMWGLVPSWAKTMEAAKDIAVKTLNAVSETIYEKPSFKNYIGKYRCLIWTNGFYEWQWKDVKGKTKIPYFIYMPDQQPFTFGGIYSKWVNQETGEITLTFSIITTAANQLLSEIHNNKKRMPLIIPADKRDTWLSEIDKDEIISLMQPLPDGILQAHPISKLITSRTQDNNVPEVQQEYKYELF